MKIVENRDLIGTELDRTLIVEAAAGTGKTTELVKRIVVLIEHQRSSRSPRTAWGAPSIAIMAPSGSPATSHS